LNRYIKAKVAILILFEGRQLLK